MMPNFWLDITFVIGFAIFLLLGNAKFNRYDKKIRLKAEAIHWSLFLLFMGLVLIIPNFLFSYNKFKTCSFLWGIVLGIVFGIAQYVSFKRYIKKNMEGDALFTKVKVNKLTLKSTIITVLVVFIIYPIIKRIYGSDWFAGILCGMYLGIFTIDLFILHYISQLEKKIGKPIFRIMK